MRKNSTDAQDVAAVTLPGIIAFIVSEDTESQLDQVTNAVRQRQRALRTVQAAAVRVGAQVRISGLSPKYLNGLEGLVETITRSRSNVRLSKMSTARLWRTGGTRAVSRFGVKPDEEHYLLCGIPLSCCKIVQYEGS